MSANRRWQYKVVEIKPRLFRSLRADELQTRLDTLGSQGWELIEACAENRYQSGYLFLKKAV